MAYIDDYFGKEYFEKERGISLKDLVGSADLSVSYERHIPINKYSFDYDIWGLVLIVQDLAPVKELKSLGTFF